MNFGYLPKSNIETGNLRTETQLINAIKKLQSFGNIPQTGKIDVATKALLKRRRCGQPDEPNSNDFTANNRFDDNEFRKRSKRYAIQGAKWDKPSLTWR